MAEITEGVNWLAVVVGFFVSYMVGWLWYSPKLFGLKWAEGVGVEFKEDMKMPVAPMAFQAVGTFLLSWVVGITAASNHLLTIILIAISFMALMAAGGGYSQKSTYAISAEVGYFFTMVVIMIICQGIF